MVGWVEEQGGSEKEGHEQIPAQKYLKSRYQLTIKVTNPFMPVREKRAISDCVGAAGRSQSAIGLRRSTGQGRLCSSVGASVGD